MSEIKPPVTPRNAPPRPQAKRRRNKTKREPFLPHGHARAHLTTHALHIHHGHEKKPWEAQ